MLSDLHTAVNWMHLLGYLLQHRNPYKRLRCLSSHAGTSRQKLLIVQAFLNPSGHTCSQQER